MELKQTGRVSGPILVDAAVLRKIAKIFDELRDINHRMTLERFGVTQTDMNSPTPLYGENGWDRIRDAKSSVANWPLVSASWEYVDGSEFKADTYADLGDLLEDGSGDLEEVLISSQYYKGTDARITFGSSWSGNARFSISGERQTVSHLKARFDDVLKDAKPPFSFLYGFRPIAFIYVGLWVAGLIEAIAIQERLAPLTTPETKSWLSFAVPLAAGGVISIIAHFLSKYYRSAFPGCEFAFGNQQRRTASKRTAIGVTLTTIVLPIVLAALDLT